MVKIDICQGHFMVRVCEKNMGRFSRRRTMLQKIFPTIAQNTAAQGDNTVRLSDCPVKMYF
jgi:hypothetical protein